MEFISHSIHINKGALPPALISVIRHNTFVICNYEWTCVVAAYIVASFIPFLRFDVRRDIHKASVYYTLLNDYLKLRRAA
jgi:hypothetical protein